MTIQRITLVYLFLSLLFDNQLFSQGLTAPPNGGNKKASVSERIGITDVRIDYDRPGVKGREGKIFGQVVSEGFADLGFGNTKAAPWRAGANENTKISFSTDVKINGSAIAAGTYGFFVAYGKLESVLIFSNNSTSWGSFFYDPKEDVLRVTVKNQVLPSAVEWLKYEFINQTDSSAEISLQWEKLKIPFTISVDFINTQLASFRKELRTDKGFTWENWDQAAQFCAANNVNLEQGLMWADSATGQGFGGSQVFTAQSTKAQLLEKLNRTTEADKIMKAALPNGGIFELHQYGRRLLAAKKGKQALEVFSYNFQKHPNEFTTCMGMTRGNSAIGNYKEALKYAEQALILAPDPANKSNVQNMIEKLKKGQDGN